MAPLFRQSLSGWAVPTTASPYFGLLVADRVAACEHRSRLFDLGRRGIEGRANGLDRELLRKRGHRERQERPAAHGEDIVQRVGRRDRAEQGRVVDHGRKEVDREDDRLLVGEPVDGSVVGGVEADEEVLGGRRDEAGEKLAEPRRRVLRGAPPTGFEAGPPRGSLHGMERTSGLAATRPYGCPTMTGTLRRVLVRAPRPEDVAGWQAYGWRSEPDFGRLEAEHEAFRAILADAGAEVVLAQTPLGVCPDAIYAYDPSLVTHEARSCSGPGKDGRRAEVEAMAADLVEAGVPIAGRLEAPATAEGGDTVWLDERTLLVGRGYRTNDAGVAALRETLPGRRRDRLRPPAPARPRRGLAPDVVPLAARRRISPSSTCP